MKTELELLKAKVKRYITLSYMWALVSNEIIWTGTKEERNEFNNLEEELLK
jgi:hypothetical protein